MIIGSLLGNNLKINNVDVEHVRCLIEVLKKIGVKIVENNVQIDFAWGSF